MTNNTVEITPVMPEGRLRELNEKNIEAVKLAESIAFNFHPETIKSIALLVTKMNSYYSNLIEGNNTTPAEIDKALENEFSKNPVKRNLEFEHVAHIEVQKKIEELLLNNADFDICTIEFLKWIHREFYTIIPDEFRNVTGPGGAKINIEPGEFRKFNVYVGNHLAIDHSDIEGSMNYFCKSYKTEKFGSLEKITAAGASHHRLAYIHPFADGNGRTARLFTHAYLIKAGINSRDLWSLSRGFARDRNLYYSRLANADEKRLHDTDGRGVLSERRLAEFCFYFSETIADQIKFMSSLFEFSKLFDRIKRYVESEGTLNSESFLILKETILKGTIKRGSIPEITGMPERTGRRELRKLLDKGLLNSDSPKGELKIAFPATVLEYYFPKLYPAY